MLTVLQIIISIFLITGILLQQRGEGLSSVFGGDSGTYGTRRGAEKTIFTATILLSIAFLITAILSIVWS